MPGWPGESRCCGNRQQVDVPLVSLLGCLRASSFQSPSVVFRKMRTAERRNRTSLDCIAARNSSLPSQRERVRATFSAHLTSMLPVASLRITDRKRRVPHLVTGPSTGTLGFGVVVTDHSWKTFSLHVAFRVQTKSLAVLSRRKTKAQGHNMKRRIQHASNVLASCGTSNK